MMLGFVLAVLLLLPLTVDAQQLTSSEETITVSTTTVGVTANTCETGNRGGAYVQVLSNGIYLCLQSAACVADSGDFTINAGTAGPQLWVKPASKIRMIRQTADSSVKIQCSE